MKERERTEDITHTHTQDTPSESYKDREGILLL
jgi:hypothetical protein